MPRANRHYLPGHIWHITYRCHQRKFLLKFARDRRRYLHWVFEARKRFGLCVLDYNAPRARSMFKVQKFKDRFFGVPAVAIVQNVQPLCLVQK
jgi:hypothetical protein